jgi:hypothetical protein
VITHRIFHTLFQSSFFLLAVRVNIKLVSLSREHKSIVSLTAAKAAKCSSKCKENVEQGIDRQGFQQNRTAMHEKKAANSATHSGFFPCARCGRTCAISPHNYVPVCGSAPDHRQRPWIHDTLRTLRIKGFFLAMTSLTDHSGYATNGKIAHFFLSTLTRCDWAGEQRLKMHERPLRATEFICKIKPHYICLLSTFELPAGFQRTVWPRQQVQ